MQLYDERSMSAAAHQRKRSWQIGIALCIVTLAICIVGVVLRSKTLTIAASCVGGCAMLFFWGMLLEPILSYHAFLDQIQHGISRQVEGVFEGYAPEQSVLDGVRFWPFSYTVDGETRVGYIDANRSKPTLSVGQHYIFTHTGNRLIQYSEQTGEISNP